MAKINIKVKISWLWSGSRLEVNKWPKFQTNQTILRHKVVLALLYGKKQRQILLEFVPIKPARKTTCQNLVWLYSISIKLTLKGIQIGCLMALEVLGSREKCFSLFFLLFIFIQEVCFLSLVSQGLAGLPVPVFGRVEWEEIFAWKWKFCRLYRFACCLLLSVLDTVW